MKIGYAKVDITPMMGAVMGGHMGTKLATSVSTNLFARSMAISTGDQTVVFSSVDVIFVSDDSVKKIREEISSSRNVKSSNIFISATHTHSGPLTTGLFGQDCEGDYLPIMEKNILISIDEALNNLKTCDLFHSGTFVNDMAFSARFIMKGNRIETHPFKYDKDIICAENVPDTSLNVLYSVDESGNITGMLVNFAQHPQIMERENPAISADYPAFIEERVCEMLQNNIPVLFFNGACGDICPVNSINPETKEIGEEWCRKYGYRLADISLRIFDKAQKLEEKITVAKKDIVLHLRKLSEEKIAEAKNFLELNKGAEFEEPSVSNYGVEEKFENVVSLEDYLQFDCWKVQEYTDILYLLERKNISETEIIEVSFVTIGDFAIVTMPFEIFSAIGMNIKTYSKFQKTAIFELTNGTAGYLPTLEAFDRIGGYETLTLYSSRYQEDSDKVVEKEIIQLINQGVKK